MGKSQLRRVSWHDVETRLEEVKGEVARKYDSLFGIPRGGLIVALLLSYKTGLPVVLDLARITLKTLVVEDIIHTGDTIGRLFRAQGSSYLPDIFALYIRTKKSPLSFPSKQPRDWLIFPWEDESSSLKDGTFTR